MSLKCFCNLEQRYLRYGSVANRTGSSANRARLEKELERMLIHILNRKGESLEIPFFQREWS